MKIQVKKYNPNMDLQPDPDLEMTPLIIISYGQTYMWPEPVLEQTLIPCKNVQPKYGSRAGSGSRDDIPQIQLWLDIDVDQSQTGP